MKFLSALILLVSLHSHAEISVESTDTVAGHQCLNGDTWVTTRNIAQFEIGANGPRDFQVRVFQGDQDITDLSEIVIPLIFAEGNAIHFPAYASGAFGFLVSVPSETVCHDGQLSLDKIEVKIVPI